MPSVKYFREQSNFVLPQKRRTTVWIKEVLLNERLSLNQINFIFCNDSYLLEMNRTYLKHDTFTDIITFDNSETGQGISGDIFISIDRVKENAFIFGIPFLQEVHRVMIHGVLHLAGYRDKKTSEKRLMRKKEDAALSLPSVPRETY